MADQRIPSAVYKALVRWKLKKMYRECGAWSYFTGPASKAVSLWVEGKELTLSQEAYCKYAGIDESNSK